MKNEFIKKDVSVATMEQTSKVLVPEKLIPLEKAVTYYNNFYHTRIAIDASDQTRAVWFNFEQLENYFNRVYTICSEKSIEITRFSFVLGASASGERTVFIAPSTYDEGFDLHRAFSFDNGALSFIHRFPGENYSSITNFENKHSLEESLLLAPTGLISTADAITLYNNYYTFKTGPFTPIMPFDTRFIHYEKGEFEGFISYLKYHKDDITGVNAIFGAKDDIPSEGLYANHTTLFFSPTHENTKMKSLSCLDNLDCNVLDISKEIWSLDEFESNQPEVISLFNIGSGAPPPPHHGD